MAFNFNINRFMLRLKAFRVNYQPRHIKTADKFYKKIPFLFYNNIPKALYYKNKAHIKITKK